VFRLQPFVSLYLRIDPTRISLLRFLLEGYDGLALLSTLDARLGTVTLLVHESQVAEIWNFLNAVCLEFDFSQKNRLRST
jgi:hypothetical protein